MKIGDTNWANHTPRTASVISEENSTANRSDKLESKQSFPEDKLDLRQELMRKPADVHPTPNKNFGGRLLGHHSNLEALDNDPTAYGNGYDSE